MITALIVDDDIVFAHILRDEITKISEQMQMDLRAEIENDPFCCLEAYKPYDVYFIDIEMPGLSGIDLVKQLQKKHIDKEFVFVSAHSEYMRKSMSVRPRGFVRKEYLTQDLRETLDVLSQVLRSDETEITIKDNLKDVRVKPSQILYMKSEEHYVRIRLASGEDILVRNKLRLLETRMTEYDFFRIHLRYLVNLNYVRDYCKYKQMVMKNGEELPVSAPYVKEVNEIFMNRVIAGER